MALSSRDCTSTFAAVRVGLSKLLEYITVDIMYLVPGIWQIVATSSEEFTAEDAVR